MRPLTSLALVLLPAGPLMAQQPERYVLDGDEVAIYNLAGLLQVDAGKGAVEVEVTRGGADASRLKVAQGEIDGRQTLRVIYPNALVHYAVGKGRNRTDLRVRDDGTFGDSDDGDHKHDHDRSRDGRRITIDFEPGGLDAHADLKVKVPSKGSVCLHLAVGQVTVTNVDGDLRIDVSSAPVDVTGFKGSLMVDVGSGNVRATQVDGDLIVDTGSGSVEVSKVRGKRLSIDTGSGEVTGSDLESDDVSVDTGSGGIALTTMRSPRIALETGSGDVRADLQGDVNSLGVETGSGSVDIKAPATLGATIEMETSSGDIETDFPVQVTRHARDHMSGQIGDGKGSIAIETGSGSVRLLKRSN